MNVSWATKEPGLAGCACLTSGAPAIPCPPLHIQTAPLFRFLSHPGSSIRFSSTRICPCPKWCLKRFSSLRLTPGKWKDGS